MELEYLAVVFDRRSFVCLFSESFYKQGFP